jgi:hypothetical protein
VVSEPPAPSEDAYDEKYLLANEQRAKVSRDLAAFMEDLQEIVLLVRVRMGT